MPSDFGAFLTQRRGVGSTPTPSRTPMPIRPAAERRKVFESIPGLGLKSEMLNRLQTAPEPFEPSQSSREELAGTELSTDPFDAFMVKRQRQGPGLSRTAQGIQDTLETIYEKPIPGVEAAAEAITDYIRPKMQDFSLRMQNRGGRVLPRVGAVAEGIAPFIEGIVPQLTPANVALTAAGAKAPADIPAMSLGRTVVPASKSAESMLALRDLARIGEAAGSGFQVGEGAAQTKQAFDEGDLTGTAFGAGMTALGLAGTAFGLPPVRGRHYNVVGEVLPAVRDRSIPGAVLPPDIPMRRQARALLPGETIDTVRGDVMPEPRLTGDVAPPPPSPSRGIGTREQRLLGRDGGLPAAEPTPLGPGPRPGEMAGQLTDPELRDAFLESVLNGTDNLDALTTEVGRRGPARVPPTPEADVQPLPRPARRPAPETRPLGTPVAPTGEGGALGPVAKPGEESPDAIRRRMTKEGYPPNLIDRVLEKLLNGETAAPREGAPGSVTEPDQRIANLPPLEERMAAAKAQKDARRAAELGPAKPVAGPTDPLEQLLGTVEEGKADKGEGFFADPERDPMTNALNRRGWERKGGPEAKPGRVKVRIDYDNMKWVNDTLGHAEGDRLIQTGSKALEDFTRRKGDLFARLGGDEFGLDIEGSTSGDSAALQQAIEDRVNAAIRSAGFPEHVGISVGVGADEGAADMAAIARKKANGRTRPRGTGPAIQGGVESGADVGTGPVESGGAPQREPAAPGGVDVSTSGRNLPVRSGAEPPTRTRPARPDPVDELFGPYLADARTQGFKGTADELRSLFGERARSAQELVDDMAAVRGEHGDERLLSEIRKYGGLRPFTNDLTPGPKTRLYGDLQSIVSSMKTRLGQTGASSIFRNNGQELDGLLQSLHQEGKWADIPDMEALVRRLEDIAYGTSGNYDVPALESALEATGVKAGKRWWTDEGDDSFDVRNFENDVLNTGEVQPRLPGAEAARVAENPTPQLGPEPTAAQPAKPDFLGPRPKTEPTALDLLREPDIFDATSALEQELGGKVRSFPKDLTVYHGTPENFEAFDPKVATFFSEEPPVAEGFALGSKKAVGNNPRVIPAKLKAENVLDLVGGPDPADMEQIARVLGGDATAEDAAALVKRYQGQRNWGPFRKLLADTGFDAARMPYHKGGNSWMVVDPQQAVTPWGTALGSAEPTKTSAPIANKIPGNVRDFLVKQLGYTDEDIAGMSPTELYRIGRERTRNPNAPPRAAAPKSVETRPAGESYDLAKMGDITDELSRFLETEVPRRQQQIAARTERVRKASGVEVRRVNRTQGEEVDLPARSASPPPVTRRSIAATREATVAGERDLSEEIAARQETSGETDSQRQSRVAKIQGERKRQIREMSKAFDRGDYKGYSDRLGAAFKDYWRRATKMGTRVEDDEPGTFLGAGLGMGQQILKDPKKYARLAGEMLANPAIRAAIGATIGGAVDDDDRMRGALYGSILAAGGPSGAKALMRGIRNVAKGHPLNAGAPRAKDLARWRLAYGPSLEASVPDVFRKVREMEQALDDVYKGAWSPETKVATEKHTKQQVGRVLMDAAKEAKAAGLKRKAWALEGYGRRYRGQPTMGQKNVQAVADSVFGEGAVKAGDIERHANTIIHRTLIGYALDSAIANQLQPILALLHVSPTNLARGYRAAATKAGHDMTEFLRLPKRGGEDVISETREILGKGQKQGGILTDPGRPLRISDDANRRRVFLAALSQKGWLDKALKGAEIPKDVHEWALSKVRRTQGDPGPLGRNPFHRGPVMGPISAFQKYPGLVLENLADAFNDPQARGKAFVAATLGLVGIGNALGIDVGEMLTSGGRPLGIDPLHPGDTLKRGLSIFPVGRAMADVGRHLSGDADHPFAALPGEGFLDSDAAQLTLGRYPVKFMKKGGEILDQGLGEHLPESVNDTRAPHTGMDDLLSLLGMKSTAGTEAQSTTADARRFNARQRQETRQLGRDKRADLERAIRSGDRGAITDAERAMTPAEKRDFYRRRAQTPYERLRQAAPKGSRQEFDERFKDRMER